MSDEARSSSEPLPDVIGKRYRIVSRLGVGGMGVVYKAIDAQLNRPVAVKALEDRRLLLPGAAQRLRSEALLAASLDHPYICKVYELVETATNSFIIMEFVEGETLASILKRGKLPLLSTLQFAREIAEGLATAHKNGLVHRDVKPANVMVTTTGHVKLLDFGVAGEDVESTPTDKTRTVEPRPTSHAGTPQYMAPEQATGQPITSRADLFSLGVLIYECLTGTLPFSGTTTFDYMRHVMQSPPRRLDRIAPETPADLVDLVERCLEKTPALRPESADAVVTELRRLSDALTSPGSSLRTARQASASKRWKIAATAALVLATAVIGWRWAWPRSDSDGRPLQRRPFATSAAEESHSRVSPDGQWVSFISTSGGLSRLMVQQVDGGEARPVTLAGGRPVSQAWSPDGKQLACVANIGQSYILAIYPAFFGGTPLATVALGNRDDFEVLSWIGRSIYLEVQGRGDLSLRRVDLDQATEPVNISKSWKLPGEPTSIDVRPDGRAAALILRGKGQDDLWTINLDGTNLRQLTNDAYFERAPVWNGRGDRILVQSNRAGQLDLWEVNASSGAATELVSGEMEKIPESTSADGTIISFRRLSQEARLWAWPVSGGEGRQLTQDTLSDYSAAASRNRVVFQRSQPRPSQGYAIIDARLFTAPFDGRTLTGPAEFISEGYAPQLSSDGAWLAHLGPGSVVARLSVLVRNLNTGAASPASSTVALPIFSNMPVEWSSSIMTWTHAGADLLFVDQPDVCVIRRYHAGTGLDPVPLGRTSSKDEYIRDLHLSPDDRLLSYLAASAKTTAVRVVDMKSGNDRLLANLEAGFTGTYSRGWLDSSIVIVRRIATHEDFTADVEILLVGPGGPPVKAGTLSNVYLGTTRFDLASRVLLATQSNRGVHNVVAFSFATRTTSQVTRNTLAGVTFSGLVPVGAGLVIGTREERGQDIWLMQPSAPQRPGNQAGR